MLFGLAKLLGLLVSVLLLAIVWTASNSKSKRHQWTLGEKIPGPRGWPILGNTLSFSKSPVETFKMGLEWFATYGTTVRVWLGTKLYIVILDPADLQIVLGNPKIRNRDFFATHAMETFFGNGLFSARDETWRLHRKLITPAFHFKVLESYVEIFARQAEILTENLLDLADGRTTDISHQLSMCALEAICETAFGISLDIQSSGNSEFAGALIEAQVLVYRKLTNPWLLLDWLYPWTSDGRRAIRVRQTFHRFSESLIASKLKSQKKKDSSKHSFTTVTDKKISSVLDQLIATSESQGQSLTVGELMDEVTTLGAAGMETTSTTMAYVLVLLGMHPEYQDKIDEELTSIFQNDKRTSTSEDLHKMKIMKYVIYETLRLFPTAAVMPREITEDLEISNGYILPAGCSAVGISYATHRNPAYYPDPERFWPERWTPENSVGRHPYAFLPFSAGPRNCIGQKYAMLAMKATLCSLLRRYRFTCDCYTMKDLEQFEISLSISSAVGYKLQMYKK